MKNKFSDTIRFVVGLIVMYAIYRIHQTGFFYNIADLFSDRGYRGGYGSVSNILLDIVPLLVDSVCFIGGLALTFLTFLSKAVTPFFVKVLRLFDKYLESKGVDLFEFDDEKEKACECKDCPLRSAE